MARSSRRTVTRSPPLRITIAAKAETPATRHASIARRSTGWEAINAIISDLQVDKFADRENTERIRSEQAGETDRKNRVLRNVEVECGIDREQHREGED